MGWCLNSTDRFTKFGSIVGVFDAVLNDGISELGFVV